MMKVKICNKRLWSSFIKIVSAVAAALSFVLTVIDFEQKPKLIISSVILLLLIVTFFVMWYFANKKTEKKMKINSTDIIIKYGDIFSQQGMKVIAFNEFFDTQVDDIIIASNTLNGIFINQYSSGTTDIDTVIDSEERLKTNIVQKNVSRPYGGKTTKYQLGSICPFNEYFLLALTHFDDQNKAYISVEDYISCLMHMWNELDRYYAGRPISITLLGSGITRFNNAAVCPQELLKYIVMSFKASKVKFNNTSSLTIVLSEKVREEINLYDIQED